MQTPLHISYRHVRKIEDVEEAIKERARKLEDIHDNIIRCHVAFEQPQRNQRSNNEFCIRVEVHIPPAHDLVVKRELQDGDIKQILLSLVHESFDALERQIKELKERSQLRVKAHPEQMANGVVAKVFTEKEYGFLQSIDGYEVYFHKNSVVNGAFEKLEIGSAVRYIEQEGEKGPQASTVQVVAKARLH